MSDNSAEQTTSRSNDILVSTGSLLAGSTWSRLLGIGVGFVTARVLGPADFGVLQIVNFVPSLAKFGSFGFDTVAQREILHLRGADGDTVREQQIKNTAFSADIIWAFLLMIGIFIFSLTEERLEIRYALWIASLTLLAGQIGRLYAVVNTVDKRFILIAQATALGTTVEAMVILTTIWWGGIYSVLIGSLLGAIAAIFWYRSRKHLGFEWQIDRPELRRLSHIAVPLAGGTIAFGLFAWIERLQLLNLYGSELLGVYMLSVAIYNLGQMFTSSIMQANAAYVFERLGDESRTLAGSQLFITPTLVLAVIFPLAGGILWLAGPWLFNWLLPDYLAVLPLLPWIGVMLTVRGVSVMPLKVMYSTRMNQQTAYMVLWLVASAIFAIVTYLGFQSGRGITTAAIAKTAAFIIMALIAFGRTRHLLFDSMAAQIHFLLITVLPLTISLLVAWILITLFPEYGWWATLAKCAIFSIAYLPFLYLLQRRTHVFNHVSKLLS